MINDLTPRLFQLTSLLFGVNFDTINLTSESSLEFFQVFFHGNILMRLTSTNHCQTKLVLLLIKQRGLSSRNLPEIYSFLVIVMFMGQRKTN
jgi:hypothetical protein